MKGAFDISLDTHNTWSDPRGRTRKEVRYFCSNLMSDEMPGLGNCEVSAITAEVLQSGLQSCPR
jgi:hypothetical protein